MLRETNNFRALALVLIAASCGAPPATKSGQGGAIDPTDCEGEESAETALLLKAAESDSEKSKADSSADDGDCAPAKTPAKPATKNGAGTSAATATQTPSPNPVVPPTGSPPTPTPSPTPATPGFPGGSGLGGFLGGLGGGGGLGNLLGGFGGSGSKSNSQSPSPAPAPSPAPSGSGGSVTYSANIAPYLQRACANCHSYLNNYEGTKKAAQDSLSRMKSGNMPPLSKASQSDISQFEAWISAGMPN